MKTKVIELNDTFNTKFILTITNDYCGNDRFNIILELYSNEFGGRNHTVIKNVMNENKADIIFNLVNEDNVILMYELMC